VYLNSTTEEYLYNYRPQNPLASSKLTTRIHFLFSFSRVYI